LSNWSLLLNKCHEGLNRVIHVTIVGALTTGPWISV